MNIDAQQVFDLFGELYPRELRHVLAELRARQAEQQLANLNGGDTAESTKTAVDG